jgi:hypothetical protein
MDDITNTKRKNMIFQPTVSLRSFEFSFRAAVSYAYLHRLEVFPFFSSWGRGGRGRGNVLWCTGHSLYHRDAIHAIGADQEPAVHVSSGVARDSGSEAGLRVFRSFTGAVRDIG